MPKPTRRDYECASLAILAAIDGSERLFRDEAIRKLLQAIAKRGLDAVVCEYSAAWQKEDAAG